MFMKYMKRALVVVIIYELGLIIGIVLWKWHFDPKVIKIVEDNPRPDYITGVAGYIGLNEHNESIGFAHQTLCVGVDEEALLIKGVEDGALMRGKHIAYDTRLTVDGQVMSRDPSTNKLIPLNFLFDDDGILIGSYSGPLYDCYEIDSVKRGTHTATYTIITGQDYSYSWKFVVR